MIITLIFTHLVIGSICLTLGFAFARSVSRSELESDSIEQALVLGILLHALYKVRADRERVVKNALEYFRYYPGVSGMSSSRAYVKKGSLVK